MIRNYKALGLAVMAMFAFSAMMAQGAAANPLTVPDGIAKVFITGTNHPNESHEFVVPGSPAVKCTHSLYSGSATVTAGQVNEITLTPTYTGCSAFGFATADVNTNNCHFTLTTPTKLKTGEVTWDTAAGKEHIHVICTGKPIEITPTSFGVSVCTQFVNTQTPTSGHLVARNAGTTEDMTLTDEVTVKGIHYTGTGGPCGTSGTNAEYSGKTIARCYANETHTIRNQCTFS